MAREWSNEKVITFLEMLQTEPCLWNPKLKSFKNRGSQSDAWRRIIELIPFQTTIEEMKKKKESLMGYYRTHLNKMKKTGAGTEGYTTNWFAFQTMDNFLREVYDSRALNTETQYNENEAQEINERSDVKEKRSERNDGSQSSSHWFAETEASHTEEENGPRPREKSQNYGQKRKLKDDLQEGKAARRQNEAFEFIKQRDDEYDLFGRLLACKLKKIRNPNTRDVLMNNIQNLVFNACMADRLDQEFAAPQFPVQSPRTVTVEYNKVGAYSPSPNPSYHSPSGQSPTHSEH